MLQLPPIYKLNDGNLFDCIYKVLGNKDLADCVLLATIILEQSNKWMPFHRKEKYAMESLEVGVRGKEAFTKGEYQTALVKYNMALMRAPFDTEAPRYCYFYRAELFLKTKQYQACVKDAETCLQLNCPNSMIQTLRKMKDEASQRRPQKPRTNPYTEEFFTLKGPRNPDVPFVSSFVEVNMESGLPKVVAARDIPVGTVMAIETAFVGTNHDRNSFTTCYYCRKMDWNLIPCEGCCNVMFCDNRCKDKAMHDGHNFECKIMDMIPDDLTLPVRATFKIRQLCSSWDEFIAASKELGIDRMEKSSIGEIFGSPKFSLLNSHHETHFIYGVMFNTCMYLANIIHYLDIHTSFLPDSPEEKPAAMRAVARVMMHLALSCTPVRLKYYAMLTAENRMILHNFHNKGFFPFIGNLPNACIPNTYVVGLWNSAALINIAPVKKGAQLSISYMGHWLEEVPSELEMRSTRLFYQYRIMCKDCIICTGRRVDNILLSTPLSDAHARAFKKFVNYYTKASANFEITKINKSEYWEACKVLSALSDQPRTREYANAFLTFVQCLMHFVNFKFPNMLVSQYV